MRCKNLEPNAKLLYGEISGLAQKCGYCFASNLYFAELFDVDERTIRRWLETLEENNFIKRESESGFGGKRKIFLSWDFQNNFTEGQKCPGGRTKMSGGGDKNVLPNNTYTNTTTNSVCVDQPPVAVSPPEKVDVFSIEKTNSSGKKYLTERNDIFLAAVNQRKDWSTEEIDEAWSVFVEYQNPINDPISFCEGIIKNKRKLKGLNTYNEKVKKCKKQDSKEIQENSKKETTETVSWGRPLANWRSLLGLPTKFANG